MTEVLDVRDLYKSYGRLNAVDHINFNVKSGAVFGILGPNGSGKTTTLGMILGVIHKTSGSFDWFGQGESHQNRKRVGAILEHPIFYPRLSAIQNLKITARIKEVDQPRFEELLTTVGLWGRHNDSFKTYSLGMKQRLAIASAMLANPDVLIFDEPTNGLDPQGIADIRDIILDIASQDKTIILASHLLDEVQKVCTDFMVLRKGKKIHQGTVQALIDKEHKIEVGAVNSDQLRHALVGRSDLTIEQEENGIFTVVPDDKSSDTANINGWLIEKGVVVNHLRSMGSNLEQEFLNILRDHEPTT
ncbi:UNVERIFIED_CONTAM: hypothetical protein GTU68_007525 [Idotea baltica]|nr:hypothetical protein [Idotea baltica]